jgi:hypothetical protein
MDNFNRNRSTVGADNIRQSHVKNTAANPNIRQIPRLTCPFGLQDCRRCKIALLVDDKIECSIAIMARELVKGTFKLMKESQ